MADEPITDQQKHIDTLREYSRLHRAEWALMRRDQAGEYWSSGSHSKDARKRSDAMNGQIARLADGLDAACRAARINPHDIWRDRHPDVVDAVVAIGVMRIRRRPDVPALYDAASDDEPPGGTGTPTRAAAWVERAEELPEQRGNRPFDGHAKGVIGSIVSLYRAFQMMPAVVRKAAAGVRMLPRGVAMLFRVTRLLARGVALLFRATGALIRTLRRMRRTWREDQSAR